MIEERADSQASAESCQDMDKRSFCHPASTLNPQAQGNRYRLMRSKRAAISSTTDPLPGTVCESSSNGVRDMAVYSSNRWEKAKEHSLVLKIFHRRSPG
jgi:hypothetical protein